jgi:hypothetical protein
MRIYVPPVGEILRVEQPWRISVNWTKYNLRWLSAFGWTGMKEIKKKRYVYSSENKKAQMEEYTTKKTVANPLFMTPEGEWKPALCVVPPGTVLQVNRYICTGGIIHGVQMKCLLCTDRKKLKNKVLYINIGQFTGLEAHVIEDESKENEE